MYAGSMRYRVLRLAASLSVRSGLHVTANATLSSAAADRRIVRIQGAALGFDSPCFPIFFFLQTCE